MIAGFRKTKRSKQPEDYFLSIFISTTMIAICLNLIGGKRCRNEPSVQFVILEAEVRFLFDAYLLDLLELVPCSRNQFWIDHSDYNVTLLSESRRHYLCI